MRMIEEQFRDVLPHFDAKKIQSDTFAAAEMAPLKESMDGFMKDVLEVFKEREDRQKIVEAYGKYCQSFFALHDTINEAYRDNRR